MSELEIYANQELTNWQSKLDLEAKISPELFLYHQDHQERPCEQVMVSPFSVAFLEKDLKLPKAVFFDMDSTLVEEESIVELAKYAGKSQEVKRETDRAMAGEVPFEEALIRRVATLDGVDASVLKSTSENFNLTPGVKDFVNFLHSSDIFCFLVSGGFTQLAGPLAKGLKFKGFHANELEVAGDQLTGKVVGTIVDEYEKRNFVSKTCKELGINTQDALAVGDGANDKLMMEICGWKIGFRCKDVLKSTINVYLDSSFDFLTQVLKHKKERYENS